MKALFIFTIRFYQVLHHSFSADAAAFTLLVQTTPLNPLNHTEFSRELFWLLNVLCAATPSVAGDLTLFHPAP